MPKAFPGQCVYGPAARAGPEAERHLEDLMDRMPAKSELTHSEFVSLQQIVAASFMSRGSLPADRRARLVELGLIMNAMGGVVPTPAGRILARM